MAACRSIWLCLVVLCCTFSLDAHAAFGEQVYITFEPERGAAAVFTGGQAAPLWLDENDFPGVVRAARDVQADIERVTKVRPELALQSRPQGRVVIIAGTIGKSRVIDGLVAARKLDVNDVRGKWESFVIQTLDRPLAGIERAIVIAGSDKRGTIYGLYDLSTQMGVSPWYW